MTALTSGIVLALLLTGIVWLILSYNLLVRDKHRVLAGWSDIDVQLKRRHDLIPKLVTTVSEYAKYERSTLQTITKLRDQAAILEDVASRAATEQDLSHSLTRVLAIAEAYPQLKAQHNFLDLQQEISNIEQDIQFARRYYNGAVNNLNTRIESFPDMLIARLFHFKPAEYFDFVEH